MTRLEQRCSLEKANSNYRNYSLWSFMVTVTDLMAVFLFLSLKLIFFFVVLLIRQDTLTVHLYHLKTFINHDLILYKYQYNKSIKIKTQN